MPRYYNGDPYWINLRYAGTCASCGARLPKGARAFYYPKGKKLFGDQDACCGQGTLEAERFAELALDEWAYQGFR